MGHHHLPERPDVGEQQAARDAGWTCGAFWVDAAANPTGVLMRYRIGAERLQQVPSLAHRPDGVFRVGRSAPVGPTHAVSAVTGAAVCGVAAEELEVLNEDWEVACFVEKCADCFATVLARGRG
jgi:hypothetical protein